MWWEAGDEEVVCGYGVGDYGGVVVHFREEFFKRYVFFRGFAGFGEGGNIGVGRLDGGSLGVAVHLCVESFRRLGQGIGG